MKTQLTRFFLVILPLFGVPHLEAHDRKFSLIKNHLFQRVVSGTVKNDAGFVLEGVTVVVKGTGTGTQTDAQGAFSLALPEGGNTLVFSSTGYSTQEIQVEQRTVIDVTLQADIQDLDE